MREMASTASTSAAAAVSSALPHMTKTVAGQAAQSVPYWIRKMPTRAIADVLLRQERHMMDHTDLFEETNKTGLMRSKRHFKHCLRMMKDQERVRVICKGPEKPGSSKRAFAVQLSKKGSTIYSSYTKMPVPPSFTGEERGLKDATV